MTNSFLRSALHIQCDYLEYNYQLGLEKMDLTNKYYNAPKRQKGKVPQVTPDEDIYDNIDDQFELPEYEKSHAKVCQDGIQENGGSVHIARPKKQPKKPLIKCVIAVLVIAGVLIALIILATLILITVQVQLLKEIQGILKQCVI